MVLLVAVNGFVGFVWFRAYQQGMPLTRTILLAVVSLVAVNLATIFGSKVGEMRSRRVMERKAGRK
jgi:hypothetical protein